MGLRLRRSIKIIPSLWFNLSKSGVGTSIGGTGPTVNLKDDKTTTTASLPGTGISYRSTTSKHVDQQDAARPDTTPASDSLWFWFLLVVLVAVVLHYLAR